MTLDKLSETINPLAPCTNLLACCTSLLLALRNNILLRPCSCNKESLNQTLPPASSPPASTASTRSSGHRQRQAESEEVAVTCRRLASPQAMKNMDWAEVKCNVAHTGTNTFIIFLCNSLSSALMQLIKTDEERNRLELECRLTRLCTSIFKDFKSTCPSVRPSVLYTVKTVSSLLRPYRCEKFICFLTDMH